MTDVSTPDPAPVNAPVVRRPRQGLPTPLLIGLAILAAVILFVMLEGRRQDAAAPAVAGAGTLLIASPPPLAIPEDYPQPPRLLPAPLASAPATPAPRAPPGPPQIVYMPQPNVGPPPSYDPPQPPPRAVGAGSVLVYDGAGTGGAAAGSQSGSDDGSAQRATGPAEAGRVRAGVLANRSTTVVQGSLIPAVLETPLDSSRPGFSRAVVSRDVRSFDGSRVLIPRGSRLIGEYRSEASQGQKRAFITWTRLIRPDGATIALSSPSGDPLGRGGIKAKVNSHFFARFGEAILQSVLDIGVNAAASATNSPVVILPGGTGSSTASTRPNIPPTLKVAQGTSISVFVARDLDFSSVERR